MQLAAFIALCFAPAFALRRRPVVLVNIGLGLWVLIPGVAAPLVVGSAGGSYSFHPSGWFIICALVVVVVDDARGAAAELARRFILYLLLAMTAVGAVLLTRAGSDPGSLIIVVDEMIAPLGLFFLANIATSREPAAALSMRNVLISLAVLESCLALLQYAAGGTIWFTAQYETNYWFNPATWTRWMGTTDHPLTLAFLLCAAAPFAAGLRRVRWQLPVLALLSLGVLVSQSRTGVVVMTIVVIFVLLRSRIGLGPKVGLVVGVATVVAAALVSPLGDHLIARVSNDTGSTAARSAAVNFFIGHVQDYTFVGDGITASYGVARAAGLASSLESSVLMYAVGLGLFFTVIYFGCQVCLVVRRALRRQPIDDPLRGAALSGLVVLLVPQTYSALAANSLAGTLLWFVLALTCVDGRRILAGRSARAMVNSGRDDDSVVEPDGQTARSTRAHSSTTSS